MNALPMTATLLLTPAELKARMPGAYRAMRIPTLREGHFVDSAKRWWIIFRCFVNGKMMYGLNRETQ